MGLTSIAWRKIMGRPFCLSVMRDLLSMETTIHECCCPLPVIMDGEGCLWHRRFVLEEE